MKIFKISMMALLLSTIFIACKKDDPTSAIKTETTSKPISIIEGLWKGEYSTTTRTAPVYFSFQVKEGGALDLLNETLQVIGSGKWILEGNVFNAVYTVTATQVIYKVKGSLTTSPGKLHGEWQYDQPYQDTGFWYMDKVN